MMKQSEVVKLVETLLATGKADNRRLLTNFQIWNYYEQNGLGLAFHEYRFKDGPFKGQRFLSTAAKVEWLNKYDNLRVIFIDGKLCGLETVSLICFDRKIEKVEKEWRSLISNYQTTWSKLSVAGFQTPVSKI